MKKIIFVINSLSIGGAEKSLISLLTNFNYKKYEVDLLMLRIRGDFIQLLPPEVNILPEIDYIKKSENHKTWLNLRYLLARINTSVRLRLNARTHKLHDAQCYWKYVEKVIDPLDKEYDVAFAWGQGNPTHYVACKVNARKKISIINANYETVGYNKKFDLPYYEKYDCIIAVSDKLNQIIKNVFPTLKERVKTVYDINDANLIEKMAGKFNPFENLRCDLILVTVGRLVEQKGYDLAIEAALILKKQNLDFKWYFVGEGPMRKVLEKQIESSNLQNNIVLVGASNNPYTYMKNSDIYVQTSRSEGYCLTLGEARILNKAIVTTDFDVVYNQITNGVNGIIVDQSGESIAKAICKVYFDKDLKARIIENLQKEKKGNIEEIEHIYTLMEF